jgi:hypothetical protein
MVFTKNVFLQAKTIIDGIVTDKNTDLSIHKKVLMCIKYVCRNSGDLKTHLVWNIRIADGTSKTIANKVRNKVKSLGLNMVNLNGFGSDDASVMFGGKSGEG